MSIPVAANERPGAFARATLVIASTCLIIMAAFGFSLIEIRADMAQRAQSRFQLDARQHFDVVENDLNVAASVAETAGRFSPAFSAIDPIAFAGYLGGITERYPWIAAIEWAPKVEDADRSRFTAAASLVLPGFEIRESGRSPAPHHAGTRTAYYPVTLVEPLGLAYRVTGFDWGSFPSVRDAFEAAATNGDLRTTGAAPGLTDPSGRPAALFVWPVYSDVPVGGTTLQRWRQTNLHGFSIVIIDLGGLLASAHAGIENDPVVITLAVADSTPVPGYFLRQPLEIAGRNWWLTASAPMAAYDPPPVAVRLGLGAAALVMMLVVLAGMSVRSVVQRNIIIRRLHREMAAAAGFSRNILDTLREPVLIVDGGGAIITVNNAWDEWQPGMAKASYLDIMERAELSLSTTQGLALRVSLDATLEGVDEDRECDICTTTADGTEQWFTVRIRAFSHLGRRHALIAHADISRLKRAERELRQLAITDGLTQLANRRHFDERIHEEAERCQRYGRLLVLLMLDIDHFKQVNDTYGHPAGDLVLRRVADICRESTRGLDLVARFGGEEFAILLPETDVAGALQLAERIREDVQATPMLYGDRTIRVTVSCGLAQLGQGDSDARQLLKDADAALYEAKKGGRNRVICRT